MMLFKLSLKNIKKSFKDYAIYFFTLILGVAIFYVFNSIESQTAMMKVSTSTYQIIKLMNNMLSGVSVFVSFVLGFLVIYASRFLIKRRKKEFGIYLTLGMSKRKISMILFFETLFIGIISLAIGLGLGIVLSQFMSILVANMFEADMTKFKFIFSSSAAIKTIIYFGIMYLIVMIFNTFNISKCKLIDLLQGNKTSEKIKLKNPIVCIIIFIISVILLGYAYYLVTGGIEQMQNFDEIFIPIILGSVSTFFIFWSVSGLLLKIVTSIKKIYYKDLNIFTLRQISSKVNTTVFSMTIICLMLFVTICILSSSLSLKNSLTANLKSLAPIDLELTKDLNLSDDATKLGYTQEEIDDSKISIKETLNKLNFNTKKYFKDTIDFYTYSTDKLLIKDSLGSYLDEASKKYPYLAYESPEEIVRLSDYNKVARLYNLKELSLKDDEYIIVADYENMINLRNEALKTKTTITILDKVYKPKYTKCQDGFIHITSNHTNTGIFIAPDNAVNDSIKKDNILLTNYKATTKEEKQKIENKFVKVNNILVYDSKIEIYEASIGLGALVTFIGLYLGIIFLISGAAILALKELSESSDNKERFNMLRRLGADEKMINKALFRQILIFFIFPLILAIIHSIFGIMFCNYILSTVGNDKLLPSIIMTAIFLIVIYGGYFLITYYCSKNIIKDR